MTDPDNTPQNVTFWFDVTCPFAWQTSRWIKEVEKVRDITVTWTPMSLAVLNDGRDLDPGYMEAMKAAWGPARVFAAVADKEPEKIDALYTALGTKVHRDKAFSKTDLSVNDALLEATLLEATLDEVGLDPAYAAVASTDEADESLRAYHQSAIDEVGDDVGTPVISVEGVAFFGPVVSPAPKGEAAGKLFDGCVLVAGTDGFFELKRTRTREPIFD